MAAKYFRKGSGKRAQSQVKIYICGFSRHQFLSARRIAEWLDIVPDHLLMGLESVSYDPLFDIASMSRLTKQRHRSMALYDQDSRSIKLITADTLEQYAHCLFHELGHHVFYSRLDARTRKKWVTLLAQAEQPVSNYGARNGREEFAECFAFFYLRPGLLSGVPLKRRFLREEVLGVPTKARAISRLGRPDAPRASLRLDIRA